MTLTPDSENGDAMDASSELQVALVDESAVEPAVEAGPAVEAEAVPAVEVPAVVLTDADIAVFLAAEPLARAALVEIAPAGAVGEFAGHEVLPDGAVLMRFANLTRAYTGWFWTAALARATPDSLPTVLEVELLPGENALISPEWRPWSEQLAEIAEQHNGAHASEDAEPGAGGEVDSNSDEPAGEEPDISVEPVVEVDPAGVGVGESLPVVGDPADEASKSALAETPDHGAEVHTSQP